MRIGIDIRHLSNPNPSGIGIYTYNLLCELLKMPSNFQFLLFSSGSSQSLKNIPHFNFPNTRTQKLEISNRLLIWQLSNNIVTLDELTAQDIDGWFFPNINIISTKLPYVITAHDISFELMPEYFSRKNLLWHKLAKPKRLFSEAECIISVSESTSADLSSFYDIPGDKIGTIPLAVGNIFEPSEKPNDKTILRKHGLINKYFLNISTLEPRKNHVGIIDAYIYGRDRNWFSEKLVFAGSLGYLAQKTLKAIKESKYSEDIFFLGYLSNSEKPALYRHATALVFPSFYEGFGLPVAESLSCGTPVITSSNSAMNEFTDFENSISVNPLHVQEIAIAMREMSSNPFKTKKTSTRTWQDVASETLAELYRVFR
jgi:glycosyltransferase involved in cell wall biosynthesis